MKWELVRIKNYNGYDLQGNIAYAKAKKLYLHRYPSNKTIQNLKKLGITKIVYQNGDQITI